MAEEENNIIEITDDEGNVIKCELYDIIEFESNQYALLTEVSETDEENDDEVVLLRYTEEDGESYFEAIEDDDEFARVSRYVETMSEKLDDTEEE